MQARSALAIRLRSVPGPFAERCRRIADSGRFQTLIFGVIVFNALVLGLGTYDAIDDDWGTVLTALVDRGVYPDPAYGLNNLAIPESLGRQDWWYRTTFDADAKLFDHERIDLDPFDGHAQPPL